MVTADYDTYINKQRNELLKERAEEAVRSANSLHVVTTNPKPAPTAQLFCEKMEAIRPAHYGGADNPYEVFAVLEAWKLDKDFYLGNVIKYVARAGKKNPAKEKEDLQKALVYLRRRIDSL
jgi:hypothetical protein